MSKIWFWIKFSILMIFAIGVGFIALPNSVKQMLPSSLSKKLSEYQLKLGIDLSGGTQLEYEVDFSEAEKRAKDSILDENPDNDIVLNKRQIANGVVKTLKKRIDPDGTKEVNIFPSKRGEKWFVIVELTSSIDTPENRAKLEKVTSLQFKEPISQQEQKKIANAILKPVISGEKTFLDLSEELQKSKKGTHIPLTLSEEELSQFFDENTSKKILKLSPNNTLDTAINSKFGLTLVSLKNIKTEKPESKIVINEVGEKEIEKPESNKETKTFQFDLIVLNLKWKDTGLGGSQFRVAKVSEDKNRNPVTSITFDNEGGELFAEITGRLAKVKENTVCRDHLGNLKGQQFAIFVDGILVSDPCVHERIDGGSAQISFGARNYKEAKEESRKLAESLNSGATPAPVKLISERKISADLGAEAFDKSIKAALIGFGLVTIWMLIFYRFFGFLAIIALGFYAAVLITILKSSSFLVLTLSGIAGIILSIGMAVDANILIFERIKEELKNKKKYTEAIQEGFDRAWTSIKDSNVSSLITCFILWGLGTSIIKAFAITLAIGILISMFTAITFTWYLVKVFVPKWMKKKHRILIGK